MNIHLRFKQRGLTLTGMMFGSIVLVLLAVLGMKVAPVYIDDATIKKNLVAVANDSTLQNASASQVRMVYIKRAQVDSITAVSAKDIKITKDKGKLVLSANYSVEVPLVHNISLKFDFDTKSE